MCLALKGKGFFQILQDLHSPQYGDVQVIFKVFTEIQNGRHG